MFVMFCIILGALIPVVHTSWLDPAGTEINTFVPLIVYDPLPTGLTNSHKLEFSEHELKSSDVGTEGILLIL